MNNHSGKTVFSIDVRDENAYNNYVSRRKSSVLNEISDRIRSILNHEDDEIDYQDGIYRIKCQDVIASAPGFNNSNPELQNFKKRSSSKIARELNTSEIPKKKIKTVDLRKWFVLCGSFVNLFLTAGFPFNMSVLYVDFLEEFGRSKAETSLVQSVCTGIFFIGGIITGSLVKRYGTKLCGFIGGLLCFVGIFAAYFATNIIYLVVSIGVLAGFGFSLNVICASASVAQNFSGRNKVLALSFVSLGSGLGGLSFPLLLQLLSLEYRWRGCLLIVSGIIMHLCACAAISGKSIGSSSVVGNITESDNQQKDDSFFKVFKILLKNKIFIAFCIALSLVLSTFNAFLIFFIDYFQSKGFERDTGVWMYSTMNLVSSAFRFLPGLIARNPKVPKLAIPAFFSATGATAMVILPFCYSFMSNIVTVSVFGLSLGGIVTVMSITTLELVGEENYPTGFGFTLAVIGIVNSIAGPVSGLIRDITGSYEYSVLLGAGSVLLACVILTTIAILHTKYGKNQAIRHNMEIEVRRKSRRRSIIWWRVVFIGGGESPVTTYPGRDHPPSARKHNVSEASRSSSQQKKDMQPNLKKCLILLGGFVNLYITGGLPFNMSVLFVEFLETFGRSKAETSLIQSVCTGTFYTGGLLSGPLVKKYGPKICGFIGGLLSFIGIFLSYFATSIIYLVFSIGLLAGAGFSLNIVAAFASVAQNFSGNGKVLAMAFVALGSGVGGLSLPLLLQFLTTEFQWRGCLMIISGIALHLCACAIVSEADDIDDGNHKNVGDSQQERKFIQSMRHCFAGFQILFKNKIFLVYCLALAICLSTFNTFLIFAIDYFQSKGFDRATAVWMYTTMNIVNTVFRFIPGILALNPYIPKLAIPSLFAATGTLSLVLLPFSNAFISNVLVLSLFGMSQGGSVTVISITTLSLVGDDNYETGFGYCLATVGIVNAVAGPISGMIRDVTGTYDYSVLAGAASAFCAFLILTTAAIVHVRIEKSRTYKISLKDEVLRISKKRTGILPWRRSFDLGFTQ